MQLVIDTIQKERLYFALLEGEKLVAEYEKKVSGLSETLLLALEIFLRQNKVKLSDLREILVHPGPGGFSSTRTGVAVANALALALNKPIAEWPGGQIKEVVLPKYDKAPNIIKPK